VTELNEEIKQVKQVKSKQRVADHGEVFTNQREVNAMLDLVKHETERIDSRFLEPACGNGNFLAEVLNRKLNVVEYKYSHTQTEWERYAMLAVCNIYGVDILEDNAKECRKRLFNIFKERYSTLFADKCKLEVLRSLDFLLHRNILWGDSLNMKNPVTHEPIIFSEWSAVNGVMFKRRDFALDKLLRPTSSEANSLLSDLGEEAFIPKPVQDFPLTHFMKLGDEETTD
jgi:hypothetical protein